MIGFGMIGCGSAAVPVAQAIAGSPLTRLVGVFDVDANLAQDLAKRFNATAAASQAELLAHPGIDAVYLAVPHDLLYPIAMQVLQAGKHALVEKPLSIHLRQAEELVSFAEGRRLTLGVYYEMHHAAPYQLARQLVQQDAIGVLLNTSHLLEAVGYITGLQVAQVSGVTATLVAPVEVEDLAAATLVYNNGAIGSVLAGAHLAGAQVGDERIQLFGAQGQLRLPDPYGNGQLEAYLRRPWGNLKAGAWQNLPAQPVDVHRAAIEEFARAAAGGETPSSNGRTACHVLATVLAIYQSAARQRMIRIEEVKLIESELKQPEL
jgi:predicted dehydrogenase